MPTVKGGRVSGHKAGQVARDSYHTNDDIKKTQQPERARDDISDSFAGDQNSGPAGMSADNTEHSTHVRNRKANRAGNDTTGDL